MANSEPEKRASPKGNTLPGLHTFEKEEKPENKLLERTLPREGQLKWNKETDFSHAQLKEKEAPAQRKKEKRGFFQVFLDKKVQPSFRRKWEGKVK